MQIYVQFLSIFITLLVDSNDLYSRFIIYTSYCVHNYFMPTSNYHSLMKNVYNNLINEPIICINGRLYFMKYVFLFVIIHRGHWQEHLQSFYHYYYL